jgi:broad specificity phosphatase PhoE
MIRLTLLCHGATAAARAAAFPLDEPLEPRALHAARDLRGAFVPARALSSPALRARQTAEALGLSPEIEPALRDRDAGTWAGLTLEQVLDRDAAGLAAFLEDPRARPAGGESTADLVARVAGWLDGFDPGRGATLAITHAAVIRAAVLHALGAPAECFGRVDIPPLSATQLVSDGRRWLWRAARAPLSGAAD